MGANAGRGEIRLLQPGSRPAAGHVREIEAWEVFRREILYLNRRVREVNPKQIGNSVKRSNCLGLDGQANGQHAFIPVRI